ncbi:glycosyltransferase [Thermosyntropha sp.]|uniref:glycosyltransferase n=1 Tax=Thermosyntropha sp. TaxID=2740820 RepID=UPI0025F2995A|nr:glycosyltransferase [Thermosyntropha sp.]MBO8158861.1 glycosyltransferase family 4 protein [Thermosyntropha sp.]
MKEQNLDILLLTPFYKQQRGNAVTARRILEGYKKNGLKTEVLSLEEENWPYKIKNILKARKPELLHIFNARYMLHVLTKVPEIKEFPFLLTLTGTDINDNFSEIKDMEQIFNLAEYIVVFHSYFAEVLERKYPYIYREKIKVIPQGVKIPEVTGKKRRDFGWEENEVVFILPSGLRPVKNIMLAVRGLEKAYLLFPQTRLVIAGAIIDKAYAEEVLNYIKKHEWIRYLGEIPHEKIGDYLALSDVAINCSLAEGQPQAVLEAMALGKPAILTDVPGNRGIIENYREGIYVKSEEDLMRAAVFLIENGEQRIEMGRAAMNLVKEKYIPESEILSYCELIERIMKNKK